MPEIPDFDTMAVEALATVPELDTPDDVLWYDAVKRGIIEQLRQVWNARGAADIDAVDDLVHTTPMTVAHAIRELDR